jgi:hypothetical protein
MDEELKKLLEKLNNKKEPRPSNATRVLLVAVQQTR